jgi:hypothetical protein
LSPSCFYLKLFSRLFHFTFSINQISNHSILCFFHVFPSNFPFLHFTCQIIYQYYIFYHTSSVYVSNFHLFHFRFSTKLISIHSFSCFYFISFFHLRQEIISNLLCFPLLLLFLFLFQTFKFSIFFSFQITLWTEAKLQRRLTRL